MLFSFEKGNDICSSLSMKGGCALLFQDKAKHDHSPPPHFLEKGMCVVIDTLFTL